VCVITLHLNPLKALLFLVLGGLLTSSTESQVQYNFIDWLKDHILALCGWFRSYTHAKIETLRARASALLVKIEQEKRKL